MRRIFLLSVIIFFNCFVHASERSIAEMSSDNTKRQIEYHNEIIIKLNEILGNTALASNHLLRLRYLKTQLVEGKLEMKIATKRAISNEIDVLILQYKTNSQSLSQ